MNFCVHKCRGERGYVLLALLLSVALLSVGFLTMVEGVEFQIKRDREAELIHRGVEYSRAVRRYVKTFGRYPTSVEQLEKSNNLRFLRRRYKDPVTGKDFRILHYGDLETFYGSGPAIPTPNSGTPRPKSPIGQSSAVSPEGQQPNEAGNAQSQQSSDQSDTAQPKQESTASSEAETVTPPPPGGTESSGTAEDTGGVAIIGVTSYSKRKSIRVFNKKDHYNQWQFVYDPSTDSGLIRGPNQPLLKGVANAQAQNGQSSTQNSATQNSATNLDQK